VSAGPLTVTTFHGAVAVMPFVECDLHPGVRCRRSQIPKLSEASRCIACPEMRSDEIFDLTTSSVTPRNPLVAGRMGPVTATQGGSY
jgi:hypothetical protein